MVLSLVVIERRGGGEGWLGWSSGLSFGVSTSSAASRSRSSPARRGLSRNTIRRALRSDRPPVYRRAREGGRARPVQARDPSAAGAIRSCPASGFASCLSRWAAPHRKTVVDDYLREVRPLFAPAPRTFQRTVYRPGEICQFDVWQPRDEVPVGHGQTRRGWVVVACLGYSRAGAGVLVFSQGDAGPAGRDRRLPDRGSAGCPGSLVWDRQAGIHGHGGRPVGGVRRVLRPAEGRLACSASRPTRRPRAPSSACRATRRPTSSPAAGSPTSSTSRTSSTPGLRRSTPAPTRRCAPGRSTGSPTSSR